ncbi:hypothetical protein GIB67_010127 [Kingdonia uniflora]|uniref:S1 motif domain-containing protein n=1 Tax=Kingdonia uniflora TaxID=39325 RepID=A0A7J7NAJ2_9MAGN|nr:hypothetical protein GIB67_010127 [Kingdonia uniflora]
MTPVIQCSTSNVALFPGTTFSPRKKNRLTIYSYQRKSVKYTSTSQRFLLPDSTSVGLNRKYNRDYGAYDRLRVHILAATGTDIAVENPIVDENAEGTSEVSPTTSEAVEVPPSTTPTTQSSRFTPRKGEMPPVKNEELVVGATFTGKVKSIQPFGAFVDFGGFKDGLVHVSQVSSSFVRDIGSFVSIGQEVTVRLLEANLDTGRISLTMREPGDDVNKSQQRKDAPSGSKSDTPRSSDKPRPARNNSTKPNQKSSKFVNGQILQGTVKNIIGRGAFISLPEGEEGFLPTDEEADDGLANMMGGSSLQVGEEVSVRVLKISRGQVTLTMKAENAGTPNLKVVQSEVHVATNPFAMAFRRNKDIAAFIDETEKLKKVAEIPIKPESVQKTKKKVDQTELVNTEENLEKGVSGSLEDNDLAQGTIQEELSSEILAPGEALASVNSLTEEISVTDEVKEVKNESEQSSDETLTPENIITDDVVESIADDGPVKDEVKEVKNESEQSSDETLTPGIIVTDEVVESIADDGLVKDEVKTDTPSTIEKEVSSSDNDEKRESVLKENASLNTSSGEAESLFTPTSSTKGS